MDLIVPDKTVSHRRTCTVGGNTFGLFEIFFLYRSYACDDPFSREWSEASYICRSCEYISIRNVKRDR
jgi:hypothetical protein